MGTDALRLSALDAIFAVHGESAIYTPITDDAITTRVRIRRNVNRYELEGGQLLTAERRTLADVRIDEIAESNRGDTIVTAAGESFVVDEIESDNGYVRSLVVKTRESS